jgi:hypothetical protein
MSGEVGALWLVCGERGGQGGGTRCQGGSVAQPFDIEAIRSLLIGEARGPREGGREGAEQGEPIEAIGGGGRAVACPCSEGSSNVIGPSSHSSLY